MMRDVNIIRKILLGYEASEFNHFEERLATLSSPLEKGTKTKEGKENQLRAEHVRWMLDTGVLMRLSDDSAYVRVTASGCGFIENIRNDDIWAETKVIISKTGGSVALDLIKKVAMGIVKTKLQIHAGIEI